MTDFFERQNIAKRKTQILLFYYIPAVALTIVTIYLFFDLLFGHHELRGQLFFGVAGTTLLVIVCGSLFKIASLQQGGSAIAAMLGGRAVPLQPQDPDQKRFRDVVEEMSIASGVPVPQLFVLPRETSINAFAAGHTTSDAAICVTQGALKLLNRDELQGVIAHEFSHILNGDMSLDMWLIGVVYGILCIALLGKLIVRLAWSGDVDNRATIVATVVGGAVFCIGIIGYFFGSLIKFAVSRQREFLADAAAVQFTRNPLGLAGALKKIGGSHDGSDIVAANADEVSHLFFANANTSWLFNTHPPLNDRIKLLDPSFDGKFPTVAPLVSDTPVAPPLIVTNPVQQTPPRPRVPQRLVYAAGLTASFPPEIDSIVREPFGASAFVYAVLLDRDDAARQKQLADVANSADQSVVNAALQYLPTVNALSKGQKLGLISIAIPALRHMSPIQFDSFSKTIQQLVESDSEISLFEYNVQKGIRRHLEPRFKPPTPSIAQYYAAAGLASECAIVFSALAYQSSDDATEINKAFQCGADSLQLPPQKQISLLPKEGCNLVEIDNAIQKITQAAFPVKKQILTACSLIVASDSLVKEDEAEMLRAIADAIGCPLPPFVSSVGIPEAA